MLDSARIIMRIRVGRYIVRVKILLPVFRRGGICTWTIGEGKLLLAFDPGAEFAAIYGIGKGPDD